MHGYVSQSAILTFLAVALFSTSVAAGNDEDTSCELSLLQTSLVHGIGLEKFAKNPSYGAVSALEPCGSIDHGIRMHEDFLTEQVLAMFPDQYLNEEAKRRISDTGLIRELTQWMRENSVWDGFNNTDDLSFWRAHQWAGSNSHEWYGVPNTSHPQWWGQPNRLDGSPIVLPHETNRWFNTTTYQRLWDNGETSWPSDADMLENGMYFNHLTNEEFVGGKRISWKPEVALPEVKLGQPLPFAPYKPPDESLNMFTGFNMTSLAGNRAGVLLRGPGYLINFASVWDRDKRGNSQLNVTVVFREKLLAKGASRSINSTIAQVPYER